ncbi:N-carbamoylsarcosine amidase [Ampelomyces quisqualis]|uniref:N-carbamoylsarcosine amidase n=1 Tax=Ampelomyces quisqualis TaxID=50730 RepID=A0A6A5QC28_AMPQU|nr:N-carbamoylsarcosine amidase [Ampelomyces quisqualis]
MAAKHHADHAGYVEAGLAGKMGWGSKPALLLIDVCNAYWSQDSPLDTSSNPASAAAPASIRKLVDAAREGKVPLIWTRVEYTEPDMSDAGVFYCKAPLLKVFQKGNETGLESWVPALKPREGELVIPKRYPSAFFATDLNTRLQLKGIDTLVICGVSTSGCVRATTLDTMCYGYRPMVVSEACGDRSPAVHDANIFDMNAKMADVVPENEAIEKLKAGWAACDACERHHRKESNGQADKLL